MSQEFSPQAHYEALAASVDRASDPQAVQALRQGALERFTASGFPTSRDEEWRQTNIAPIAKTPFALSQTPGDAPGSEGLYDGCDHLVMVDGHVVRAPESPGVGITALPMREALSGQEAAIDLVGRNVPEGHAFADLNTSLFSDGLFLHVSRGERMERPLQVHHVVTGGQEGAASFPRHLVIVEDGAEGNVVETYQGPNGTESLTSAVTELRVGDNAGLRHVKVMREGDAAYHVSFQGVELGRSARLHSVAVNLGGAIVRNDLRSLLEGEGIDCVLNGLVLGRERQLIDNHLWMEHAKPHCYSHQLYKGVLADRARTVFNGRIYVHQEAQKTDAVQTNRNLLLSQDAIANSNPQLEIFADDVKCTHGSTIGQLEEEALFYLRTRGIDPEAARGLLVYAFASEVLQEIELEALRSELEEVLVRDLTAGTV